MNITDNFLEDQHPISLSTHGAVINVISDSNDYIHANRLLHQYFPTSRININKEGINSTSASKANVVVLITSDKKVLEGSFILRTGKWQQQPALLIRGGGIPGVIYAINELGKKHIITGENAISIPLLNVSQSPTLPYRFFWTWDHSTNWYLEQNGMQEIGFANPYSKPADGFLEDYCRLIDFMSLNRINGVTIYGFLRDSHGGIDAAQTLCRYATERGVRIFPGVGINSYGGIYWEGEHSYNLTTWLQKHPELRAQFAQPKYFKLPEFAELYLPETSYLNAACPSKTQNIDYHVEAIQWLSETFQIGGINFETGDYGTCQCNDCITRRSKDQQWSHKDMAFIYPRLFSAVQQSRKDAWLVCEAYWDNLLDLEALAPLKDLPNEAIYQFCINRNYWHKLKNELTLQHVKSLPRLQNILRTHMGSQWQHERYGLVAKRFSEMIKLSYDTGLKGATIFGEPSAFHTVNEINYLAFARFGYDATLSWEEFVRNDLSPLFGDTEAATHYLHLLDCQHTPRALNQAIGEARELSFGKIGDVYRRWVWLQNYLYQKLAMSKTI